MLRRTCRSSAHPRRRDVAVLLFTAATLLAAAGAALPDTPGKPPPPAAIPGKEAPAPGARAARPPRGAAIAARRGRPGNLVGHGGPIRVIHADPASGRVLTGSFDYSLMVWDVSAAEPKRLLRLDRHDGAVNAAILVPSRGLIVTGSDDGAVSVWDAVTGALLHRFKGHGGKVIGLAVSPDGGLVASASWDRTVRLYDIARLTERAVLSGHLGPANAVAFSGDGRHLYSAGYDGQIRLWDAGDGAFKRPLHKHAWGINVLERLAGGELLVFGALDGSVGVVDAAGEGAATAVSLPAHDRPVLALAQIAKPGLVATAGGDGLIRVLRMGDWRVVEEHRNPFGPIWALGFLAGGGALYYGGLDDFATLWRISPREPFEAVEATFPRRFQVRRQGNDLLAEGEAQFARKCSVCHTLEPDGANRAGPTLFGIFGRRIATLPGYPFSDALRRMDIVWSEETVARLFELGPDVFTPGSKMPLQQISDPRQRAALIHYLKSATVAAGTSGNPGR